MPGFPVLHHLLELAQTHVRWVSGAIQPSHPLSSPSPFAFSLSQHQCLSSELVLGISWLNYWSFSFSISPSNECSGLTSLRIDWFHLLAVQGTLRSLFQHHNWKASILQCSTFFMIQFSYPYMTMGKTIALTLQTFVGRVMSLLFKTLSSFVIAFLPRSKASWDHLFQLFVKPINCFVPQVKSLKWDLQRAYRLWWWESRNGRVKGRGLKVL